jgi:nucleotide-binding universal stress UspA family protein
VFLGFDYTVPAEAALTWARELRRAGPCRVTVAYANWPDERERLGFPRDPSAARNPEPVQDALERSLRARVSALVGDDVRVVVQAARGRADLALLELATEAQADLIVTGTHQQKGLSRLLNPSVSRGLLHAALVSVVTVPAAQALRRVPPVPVFRRVMVATDFSPLGNRAIAHAFAVAQPGGLVQIVHVVHPLALAGGEFESSPGPSAGHASYVRACERKLRGVVPDEAESLGLGAEVAVVEDEDPAAAICRQAELFGADVIVMGSQGRSALARVMLGSVAQSVMASSKRPIFIVRAPKS